MLHRPTKPRARCRICHSSQDPSAGRVTGMRGISTTRLTGPRPFSEQQVTNLQPHDSHAARVRHRRGGTHWRYLMRHKAAQLVLAGKTPPSTGHNPVTEDRPHPIYGANGTGHTTRNPQVRDDNPAGAASRAATGAIRPCRCGTGVRRPSRPSCMLGACRHPRTTVARISDDRPTIPETHRRDTV